MPTDTYDEILKQVRRFTPEEQLQLIEDIITVVRHHMIAGPKDNITELKGLGKELWQDVDVKNTSTKNVTRGIGLCRVVSSRYHTSFDMIWL